MNSLIRSTILKIISTIICTEFGEDFKNGNFNYLFASWICLIFTQSNIENFTN